MIFDEPRAEVSRAQNSAPSQFPLAFSVVSFFGAKRGGRRSGAGSWARFDTDAQAAHSQQNQERDIPITCEIRDERPIFP